ncbi:hypothetical protein OXX80_005708, partial [Metschnikowia pulcherrima]
MFGRSTSGFGGFGGTNTNSSPFGGGATNTGGSPFGNSGAGTTPATGFGSSQQAGGVFGSAANKP